MKKTQQLSDLPVRYQKIPKSNWYMDTNFGTRIHKDNIHKYTLSYKKAQEEKIVEARWDLKN